MENKINGNRTFVGSKCIRNIDPRVNAVIAYFNHILHKTIQGEYKGQEEKDLHRFTIKATSRLVKRLHDVEHLKPLITRNLEGKWQVLVKHPKLARL